jgi:acetyl-CoA carboxylase biotin carboxyl carrier protein
VIKSPFVGTFRRAEQQTAQPFVQVGDQVTADTMVCMVEVLGELKPIRAGMSGVVLQMPVDDGAPVEFGQALAAIAPIA